MYCQNRWSSVHFYQKSHTKHMKEHNVTWSCGHIHSTVSNILFGSFTFFFRFWAKIKNR